MKKVYGNFGKGKTKIDEYLNSVEVQTKEKLESIKKRQFRVRKSVFSPRKIARNKTANPATKMLFLPMLFKAWKNFTLKNGIINEEDSSSENDDSQIKK